MYEATYVVQDEGGWAVLLQQCHPNSGYEMGLSSLLEGLSEIPIVFVVSFVFSATPQTGGNGQGI